MRVFTGKSVFSGIAFGSVFLLQRPEGEMDKGRAADPATEWQRFETAKKDADVQLAALYEKTKVELGEQEADIIDVQRMMLDDGEKHLFAWLHASKLLPSNVVIVTTADKAALVASNGLGWLNCMTSLEDLARKAGVGRVNLDALALQYREDWLSSIKTKIMLGIIP